MKKILAYLVITALIITLGIAIYKLWQINEQQKLDLEKLQYDYNIVQQQYDATSKDAYDFRSQMQKLARLNGQFQQIASNIVHLEGINQFYRGIYAVCLLDNGAEKGEPVDPVIKEGCLKKTEKIMGMNFHGFRFSKPRRTVPPSTFSIKLKPADTVVPLLPYIEVPQTQEFDPYSEPEQQPGPVPAPSIPPKGSGASA